MNRCKNSTHSRLIFFFCNIGNWLPMWRDFSVNYTYVAIVTTNNNKKKEKGNKNFCFRRVLYYYYYFFFVAILLTTKHIGCIKWDKTITVTMAMIKNTHIRKKELKKKWWWKNYTYPEKKNIKETYKSFYGGDQYICWVWK